MTRIQELRDKLTRLWEAVKALRTKAESEKRDLTVEELHTVNTTCDEIELVQATLDTEERVEKTKKSLDAIPAKATEPEKEVRVEVGENNNEKKPWVSFGEQMLAIKRACAQGAVPDVRLMAETRASGSSEGVGSEGGFLVQQDYTTQMLEKVYEVGQLAARCANQPISANSNSIKLPRIDENSRADGSRYGGVRAYWAAEAATVTASKPAIGKIELELKKLLAICYATDELLEDAAAMDGWIRRTLPKELAFKLDEAIYRGTGAGVPLGILNSGCLVTVAKEAGQAAGTVVFENLVKMYARMPGYMRPQAAWFYNQDVEPQFFTMGIVVGTGGSPAYMPPGGLSQSPYATLFGRPMIPIETASTVGTVGDITFANMQEYLLAQKGGVRGEQSMHVRFQYDEMAYRFILRVDGQPVWSAALTPNKGSNTLSPFVTLATR